MSFFSHPSYDSHEGVHVFRDQGSELRCIIAIHSTMLGPAVGGCRVRNYESEEQALDDALRLSRGMSYRNALAGLRAGGGKAVILAPRGPIDRRKLFQAFGRVVERLGGEYITAEDVGSTLRDMEIVASQTSYVAGLPPDGPNCAGGDPSPWTARGVFLAMQAAVKYKLNCSLSGVRVAVQGLGNVGLHLCRHLHDAGARLIVSSHSERSLEVARDRFGAQLETVDRIVTARAEVLAPCALGGAINRHTIPGLRAQIICGAANNQLADADDGAQLRQRNVLYCPDYVVNAGGIINVMAEHAAQDIATVNRQIENIPLRLLDIIAQSERDEVATNAVADCMARAIVDRQPSGSAAHAAAGFGLMA